MVPISKHELHKASVVNNIEIAPQTFILSFKRTFSFLPGQVVALTTTKEIPPRLYSIASGNNENNITILFDIKTEGELTPKLSSLRKGDSIYFSLPFGKFIDNSNPSYWIATGTGIAPFLSMAKSGLVENKILIHGAGNKQLFFFSEYFKATFKQNYIQCCSQCSQKEIFRGRLTVFLKTYKNLSLNEKYYLCGSAEMVVDVRDILIKKGLPFDRIISEIYF